MQKSDTPGTPKKRGGGPKTPEGKARSAMNAVRHGLLAKTIVLPTEDNDEFQRLVREYMHALAPDNPLELHLIEELVAARWRMQRAWGVETTAWNMGMKRTEEATLREYGQYPNVTTTNAFIEMSANNRDLQLINRYEARLARRFHQVLDEIKSLRKDGLIRNSEPLPDLPPAENCETNSPAAPPPENCETNSTAVPPVITTPSTQPMTDPDSLWSPVLPSRDREGAVPMPLLATETDANRKLPSRARVSACPSTLRVVRPDKQPDASQHSGHRPSISTPVASLNVATKNDKTNPPAEKVFRCTLFDPKTGKHVEVTAEERQAHIDRILARQYRRQGEE